MQELYQRHVEILFVQATRRVLHVPKTVVRVQQKRAEIMYVQAERRVLHVPKTVVLVNLLEAEAVVAEEAVVEEIPTHQAQLTLQKDTQEY